MKLNLKIWRQKGPHHKGEFVDYVLSDLSPALSFLEMLDYLNEQLITKGEKPVVFDSDCREGICGACSMVINGSPHGPHIGTTVCQLHLRSFKSGDTLWIEPFRAKAFPVVQDLMVDRSSLDRIIMQGGYISVRTGSAPSAHAMPVDKSSADRAFINAACIGCGACVAVCKNASASLFTAAKVTHLSLLPQGKIERKTRVRQMVQQMEKEFGACTNTGACSKACPKEIPLTSIARMNKEYIKAQLK